MRFRDMEIVWLLLGGHRLRRSEAEQEQAQAEERARESESEGGVSEGEEEEREPAEPETEEEVRMLARGEAWDAHVEKYVSENTKEGLAMERIQNKYPREWLYNDDAEVRL